jgi:hypothetical protein
MSAGMEALLVAKPMPYVMAAALPTYCATSASSSACAVVAPAACRASGQRM